MCERYPKNIKKVTYRRSAGWGTRILKEGNSEWDWNLSKTCTFGMAVVLKRSGVFLKLHLCRVRVDLLKAYTDWTMFQFVLGYYRPDVHAFKTDSKIPKWWQVNMMSIDIHRVPQSSTMYRTISIQIRVRTKLMKWNWETKKHGLSINATPGTVRTTSKARSAWRELRVSAEYEHTRYSTVLLGFATDKSQYIAGLPGFILNGYKQKEL